MLEDVESMIDFRSLRLCAMLFSQCRRARHRLQSFACQQPELVEKENHNHSDLLYTPPDHHRPSLEVTFDTPERCWKFAALLIFSSYVLVGTIDLSCNLQEIRAAMQLDPSRLQIQSSKDD